MKRFIAIPALIALLFFAVGCQREPQTDVYVDETAAPLKEGSDAAFTYTARVEYVTGGVPQATVEKINGAIAETTFGVKDLADVPAAAVKAREEAVKGYREACLDMLKNTQDEIPAYFFNWTSDIQGGFETACPARHLQTYLVHASDYSGGAHGMFGDLAIIFDTRTWDIVTEETLFSDDYVAPLSELLWAHRFDGFENPEAQSDDLFFASEIAPNGNFTTGEEGITYVFNPYEIAPYASGIIRIPLPWNELEPLLRK